MGIRESEEYKKMTLFNATQIIETDVSTEEESMVAWQYLSDTNAQSFLQGFYGRTIAFFLEEELILPRP